jgi:hypothetical protein
MVKLNELPLNLRFCVNRVIDFAVVTNIELDVEDEMPGGRNMSKSAMRVFYTFNGKEYSTLVRKTVTPVREKKQ